MAKSVTNCEDRSAKQNQINQRYGTKIPKQKREWHTATGEDIEVITNWYRKVLLKKDVRFTGIGTAVIFICSNAGGIAAQINGEMSHATGFFILGNLTAIILAIIGFGLAYSRCANAISSIHSDIRLVIYDYAPYYNRRLPVWQRRVYVWEWNADRKMFYQKECVPSWKRIAYMSFPSGQIMYLTKRCNECIPLKWENKKRYTKRKKRR